MEFRPCPSFPGYSASECGAIKRDAWTSTTKTGKVRYNPAKVLEFVGRDARYVLVNGKFKVPEDLVGDAWIYPDQWEGWAHQNDYRVKTLKRPPANGSK